MPRGPIPNKSSNRPSAVEIAEEIVRFYQVVGHSVGGALHIVIEDENIDDKHIHFAMSHAHLDCSCGQHPCEDSLNLGRRFLALTRTQRRIALARSLP